MTELEHWHAVLFSNELGKRPVRVRLHSKDLVLFRTGAGVGALEDRCPHRNVRLSAGWVEDGRITCPYHAWSFGPDGCGQCPTTPKLEPRAVAFEAAESQGVVWVRLGGDTRAVPHLELAGFAPLASFHVPYPVPLELALDNFVEGEHAISTHLCFGFDRDRAHELEVRNEHTETTVRSVVSGPINPRIPVGRLFGIRSGDRLTIDGTYSFSPLMGKIDLTFSDWKTGKIRGYASRFYVFLVPRDPLQTDVMAFTLVEDTLAKPLLFPLLVRPLLSALSRLEFSRDQRLMREFATLDTRLSGMQLGRCDKVIGLARARLERIYRGLAPRDAAPGPGHPLAGSTDSGSASGSGSRSGSGLTAVSS
jgi:vanillate O-demethylase monooxygenase subunit